MFINSYPSNFDIEPVSFNKAIDKICMAKSVIFAGDAFTVPRIFCPSSSTRETYMRERNLIAKIDEAAITAPHIKSMNISGIEAPIIAVNITANEPTPNLLLTGTRLLVPGFTIEATFTETADDENETSEDE